MFCFFFKQKTAYELLISDWSFRRVLFRSMTATLHIGRRTTPHHPLTAFTGWLTGRLRRRPRPAAEAPAAEGVEALDIEALRLSLPLDDPDRSEDGRAGKGCVSTCTSRSTS